MRTQEVLHGFSLVVVSGRGSATLDAWDAVRT
jgi:hypothetical protein